MVIGYCVIMAVSIMGNSVLAYGFFKTSRAARNEISCFISNINQHSFSRFSSHRSLYAQNNNTSCFGPLVACSRYRWACSLQNRVFV